MNNRKEVWLLVDSKNNGGIETHILQLAIGLRKHEVSVKVVFLKYYGEHPLRDSLNSHNIRSESLDGKLSTLYTRLKQCSPSIVHTHGYKAGIIGRFLSKLLGIASISTHHSGDLGKGKVYIYGLIDRITASLSRKNFSVSKDISNHLYAKSEILNNFINTDDVDLSYGGRIAYVGRISEEKGPDIFVNLTKRVPDNNFYLYGDGPGREELQKTSPANIHFLGCKESMTPYWGEISLLIMPSRHEGLPLAAIEAMARGIPVIASDVGQLGELISHRTSGWLIKVGDIKNLEKYTREWLSMSSQKRLRIRQAARKHALKHFSSNAVIPSIIHSYNKICNCDLRIQKIPNNHLIQ